MSKQKRLFNKYIKKFGSIVITEKSTTISHFEFKNIDYSKGILIALNWATHKINKLLLENASNIINEERKEEVNQDVPETFNFEIDDNLGNKE